MDTTGTFEMASALGRHKMSTALHKHYTAKEYIDFFQKLENKSDAFYSLGIGEHDWQKFREVMAAAPGAIRRRLHGAGRHRQGLRRRCRLRDARRHACGP